MITRGKTPTIISLEVGNVLMPQPPFMKKGLYILDFLGAQKRKRMFLLSSFSYHLVPRGLCATWHATIRYYSTLLFHRQSKKYVIKVKAVRIQLGYAGIKRIDPSLQKLAPLI